MSYFEVTTTDNSSVDRKVNYNRLEITEAINNPKEYKLWCNIDDSTGDFGTYPYYPREIKIYKDNVITGTNTTATANKLTDSAADFDGSLVGMPVHNTTDDTWTRVTAVDSKTVLSIAPDIFTLNEAYEFSNLIFKGNTGARKFEEGQLILNNIDIASKIVNVPSINRYWRSHLDYRFKEIIYGARDTTPGNTLDDTDIKSTPSIITLTSASASDDGVEIELFGIFGTAEYGSEVVTVNGGGTVNTTNTFKEFWCAEANATLVGDVDYTDASANDLGSTTATTRISSNENANGVMGNGILYNTNIEADSDSVYDYRVYESDDTTPRPQNYTQSGWKYFYSDKVSRLQSLNDLCAECVTTLYVTPEWYIDYENDKLYVLNGIGSVRIEEIVLETGVNCGNIKISESPNVSNFQHVTNLNNVKSSATDSTSITYYTRKTIANIVNRTIIDDHAPSLQRIAQKYINDYKYPPDIVEVPDVNYDLKIILGDTVHVTDRQSGFDWNCRVLKIVHNIDRLKGNSMTLTVSTNTGELPLALPEILTKLKNDINSMKYVPDYETEVQNFGINTVVSDYTNFSSPSLSYTPNWNTCSPGNTLGAVDYDSHDVYYSARIYCDGSGTNTLVSGDVYVRLNPSVSGYFPSSAGVKNWITFKLDVVSWATVEGVIHVPANWNGETYYLEVKIPNYSELTVMDVDFTFVDVDGHTHNILERYLK